MLCIGAALGCDGPTPQPPVRPTADTIAPPDGLLAEVRVAPLPRISQRIGRLGQILADWETAPEAIWPLVRELLLGVTDLAEHIQWNRPLGLLILDPARHPGTLVGLIPVADPARALKGLAARCKGQRRSGAWVFTGGGRALLDCRFAAAPLSGALAVASDVETLAAVRPYAEAVARSTGPMTEDVQLRIFVASVLGKLGLTPEKARQAITALAAAAALALGELTELADIRKQLEQLLELGLSAGDLNLGLTLHPGWINLRLYASARPGGALHRWLERQAPAKLRLAASLPAAAPISLSVARNTSTRTPAKSAPTKRTGKSAPTEGASTKSASTKSASTKSAPGLLTRVLLTQLPGALRAPTQALIQQITGRATGEIAASLDGTVPGGLRLLCVIEHDDPAGLVAALKRGVVSLATALRGHLRSRGAPTEALAITWQHENRTALLTVDLRRGWATKDQTTQTLVRLLTGGDRLYVALAQAEHHVVLGLGDAQAGKHVEATLARLTRPAPRLTLAAARPRLPSGRLGALRLSLTALARMFGLLADLDLPRKDTGAIWLHWGVGASKRQLDLTIGVPVRHLKAVIPVLERLLDQLDKKTKGLDEMLPAGDDEAEDAL